MANTKKIRSERKIVVSFSVKTRHLEDFKSNCANLGLVPSNEIERLIVEFNNNITELREA